MSYDESSIKVLGQAVADERFGYAKVEELHRAYPHTTRAFIERLVTAAQMSGWGVHAAEAKYLAKTAPEAPPEEFTAIYLELMAESKARIERGATG